MPPDRRYDPACMVRRPRRPAFALALALAPGLTWALGVPARAEPPPRVVIVQNLAPSDRREWAVASVPFAPGTVQGLPDLHVEGHPTVWQPFGARWPDGSLRQALCLFPVEMRGLSERALELRAGRGPDLDAPAPAPLLCEFAVRVRREGRTVVGQPQFVRILEQNAARVVALFRCRLEDTGLVFELILESYAGQRHGNADLALFFSDPRTEAMQVHVDEVAVLTRGMALVVRHAAPLAVDQRIVENGSEVVLLRDAILGDGQGIRRTGVLVPRLTGDGSLGDRTLEAAVTCPLLAATSWHGTGAFGAFGYVPEPPPWLQGPRLRAALARRHRAFVRSSLRRGEPFARFPFGLAKQADQTGDQEDFGVVKLSPVAWSGIPSFLYEVELSVLQDPACRPVHFYEADGRRVRAAEHPDWVVWSGRTHWHCGVSKDRLGKPCPAPRFESHGWTGKDRQHWSSNYAAAFYLLTGKHWMLRELENEVQLYLAGQTLDPELSTSHAGAARGVGRTLHAATWLYLCTGDGALLERMRRRVEKVIQPEWAGRDFPEDHVRPFQVCRPDPRYLGGKGPYWKPWEESLAVIGLAAMARLTGHETARNMADELALNVLRHGWLLTESDAALGFGILWKPDGSPLSRAEIEADPEHTVHWSRAMSEWGMPAVEIARQAAARRGATELEERANRIQRIVRGRRRPSRDGWMDRLTEWDAVR